MQAAIVLGSTRATTKHPTLKGWKLLSTQPLLADGGDDGPPLIAIDQLGAGRGDKVILTSDGGSVRDMVGDKTTPVRWAVIGILDD